MEIIERTIQNLDAVILWGAVASGVMAVLLEGSRALGLSRMSLPFLFGSCLSGNRLRAEVLGFGLYFLGGWLFAFGYAMVFASLQRATWWIGGILGVVHALFLLVVLLPVLPAIHPRMANEFDGPDVMQRLEPPGIFGLNYGRRTPITTFAGQLVYGVILGAFMPIG